ncbi:riboflavin synthase [Treponema sp.]|uniref:riboflavin synthase n=1 Tax=Treponema sp. TaxID=166 RepID=UPI0025FFDCDD|nr:riboflavin synthase [Treponema sp.]MCR5218482.1 riboflavin synthase [Treponema sp.]
MFTGIVEELGSVSQITQNGSSLVLELNCSFARELTLGESVAVNGVCLTVTNITPSSFSADVTPETFRRTSLNILSSGSPVNLERAMKADGRFGGHIVSGHIDGCGRLVKTEKEENAVNVYFCASSKLGRYIIEKGSVAIDGISLTVASLTKDGQDYVFSVAVIPHTWENTILSKKNTGAPVNIECDMVGKYIEHFMNFENNPADDSIPQDFMTGFTSFH